MCKAPGKPELTSRTLVKQKLCPELPKAKAHNLLHSPGSYLRHRPNVEVQCFYRADCLPLCPKPTTFMQPLWLRRLQGVCEGVVEGHFVGNGTFQIEKRCRILSCIFAGCNTKPVDKPFLSNEDKIQKESVESRLQANKIVTQEKGQGWMWVAPMRKEDLICLLSCFCCKCVQLLLGYGEARPSRLH